MSSFIKKYETLVYIFIAYSFSVAMRMFWVIHFNGVDSFYWDNQMMINTNDGYFWASGVQNLFHHTMPDNLRVPGTEYGMVYFTYLVAKILPFSLDTIILYMPMVVSSLIVIPIILLMKLYDKEFLGFLAALLASITWSFYNRTMVGYYDSDLFALVFPVFIIYFLIKGIKEDSFKDFIIVMLLNSLYSYAYDVSAPILYSINLGFILYSLVFLRKNENVYYYIFLLSISILNINWELRFILMGIGLFIAYNNLIKEKKHQIILAAFAVGLFLLFNHVFELLWWKVYEYVATGTTEHHGLKFYQVHQTIREAGKIPFETFANRILGSEISFILGVLGYLLLVFKKKEFLLFLPLVGIGFFAYIGGLRFTVYAIPAMAIGAIYLFYFIFDKFIHKEITKNIALSIIALAFLYPNIKHIQGYLVSTVFQKEEVKVLDKLKSIASPKDYTLTWWDYGYPIWYYSNTNTLIDGGKHQDDNYIISKILFTDSPMLAANLARLSVEEYVKAHKSNNPIADKIFNDSNMTSYSFLEALKKKDFKLPPKKRDIYLYLPSRMMRIVPTILLFSNLDLETGMKKARPFFYRSSMIKEDRNFIYLGSGVKIDKRTSIIWIGRSKTMIKRFSKVFYDKQGKLHKETQQLRFNRGLNVIYMKNYGQFLVLDDQMYNSLYIQMFVFENYDKNLFEPVILSPFAKVYKLKK